MSHECTYCDFSVPTRSRYMRHLGTQKHARKYLEATKHLVKGGSKKEVNVQEEEEVENVQEEEEEEIFMYPFFLDIDTIRFLQSMSVTIELSPWFVWIVKLFNQFKNIIPQKGTLEPDTVDVPSENLLGH